MLSLLATTHEPDKIFHMLNEIHRRLSHWNCHTDQLTFVARSSHCHQALAVINNATNDSLVSWIVLWTLTHPVLLVKALGLCWPHIPCYQRLFPTPVISSLSMASSPKRNSIAKFHKLHSCNYIFFSFWWRYIIWAGVDVVSFSRMIRQKWESSIS